MKRNSRLRLYWLSLALTAAVGCGEKDEGVSADDIKSDDNPSNDGDDDGDNGKKDAGTSRSMDAGNPDEHPVIDVPEEDATCAATSAEAPKIVVSMPVEIKTEVSTTKPVAIYLMLDRSSSMVGTCQQPIDPSAPKNCNPDSWKQATEAITAFANDPASKGIDVALGYFPPLVPIMQADKAAQLCTGNACATPTVSMRPANDNAAVIADSLNSATPPNSLTSPLYTPTECALRGLAQFCKGHTERTMEKCVGVLITDGVPQGDCNVDTSNMAPDAGAPTTLTGIAAQAAAAGTQIFTLGLVGARFEFLDRLAAAGNTDCTPNAAGNACNVTAGKDAFIAALKAIRETVVTTETHTETHTETKETPLDCEWDLPDPPEDMKFDGKKVNVRFSATGKETMILGRVTSEEECTKHPEGWRFDSESDPQKVLACSGACDTIKSSSGAKIDIEFGCQGKSLE